MLEKDALLEIEKIKGKYITNILNVLKETSKLKSDEDWRKWIRENPEKAAFAIEAYLKLTVSLSMF